MLEKFLFQLESLSGALATFSPVMFLDSNAADTAVRRDLEVMTPESARLTSPDSQAQPRPGVLSLGESNN